MKNLKAEARKLASLARSKTKGAANALAEKLDDLVTTEAERRAEETRLEQEEAIVRLEQKLAAELRNNERLRQLAEDRLTDLRAARSSRGTALAVAWVFGVSLAGVLVYVLVI